MKPVQEGAAGSQKRWPERSASKWARSEAGWKALAWWSNHQSSRGEVEYRKSTMAFTSADRAPGGMGSPGWCCTGRCSIAVSRAPSRAWRKRPSSAAEAQPSKQFAW